MNLAIVACVIFIHMCLVFLWYRKTNNPSVVDVGWGLGLSIAGITYLCLNPLTPRSLILGAALLLWGARLSGYLWWSRIRLKKVDKRYEALSEGWKIAKPLGFFLNFQLQGVLIFILSLSWYFIAKAPVAHLDFIDLLLLAFFLVALGLETKADLELQEFKRLYPKKVCDYKLWRLSRHPNYFFEWLIWCAFSLFALRTPLGMIALVSPLCLYLIMTRITAPMTEEGSLQSRGEAYCQYQKTTPMFFPRLKKRWRD